MRTAASPSIGDPPTGKPGFSRFKTLNPIVPVRTQHLHCTTSGSHRHRQPTHVRLLRSMASLSVPPVLTSPRHDAIALHRAFKGFGCDSTTVINILAHRDATQRALIMQEYRAIYHQDLYHRLSTELSGNHKKAMLLWVLDPVGRDAAILNQSLNGDITDLRAATEVICSRTPSQLHIMRQAYRARFGCYLEHDVAERTYGDHQKLLLAYLGVPRYEGPEVDPAAAARDARDLYRAGEKRLGTDERAFIRVFTERSWAHLAAVAGAYRHLYARSLDKAVKSETSGTFELGLLTILRCAESPARHFAKVLHKAMKGLGTSDTALIRVVVTRAEVDMQYIKAEYHKKYKRSLADAIHSETSGNYRTFLLSLVGRDR
ncbi:annexin D5-like [Hordeum vulgare subsp. vulgare]|uniref:Annexin n=1 Tax=Hordeum vulgare subsp. vulgare TaxID=112509 RepID=A0A8I7BB31_HORVV|nr:annexin D5-like [Hordeum vulgare subsp. vulgare]